MVVHDKKHITEFYESCTQKHGFSESNSVGWTSKKEQETRFAILSQIGDFENASILDVGAGLGDFYLYMKNNYKSFQYKGVDLCNIYTEACQKKYGDDLFVCADFESFSPDVSYDYVVASGALSMRFEDYKKVYFKMIEKMFNISRKGLAFNMLNQDYHVHSKLTVAWDVDEVYKFCAKLTDKLVLKKDYIWYDFSLYLYH